jgi:heme/copper-type cytochrome/quinol oxidase subunit 2
MLALTPTGWTQIIVALSIFVPVIVAAALTVWVLRGKRNDPDEQRWRRLEAERRAQSDMPQRRE